MRVSAPLPDLILFQPCPSEGGPMPSRIFTLILALMLVLSACKSKQSSNSEQATNTQQPEQTTSPSPPAPSPAQSSTANQQPAPTPSTTTQATESRPSQNAQLPQNDAGTAGSESLQKRAEAAPPPPPPPVVIPAGTAVTVRLSQAIDAKTSKPGDRFIAAVARPVALHG